MITAIKEHGLKRDEVRAVRRAQQDNVNAVSIEDSKPSVFRYELQNNTIKFEIKFRRSNVSRREIVEALEGLMRKLEVEDS